MKKYMKQIGIWAVVCILTFPVAAQNVPTLRADNIDEVVRALTLEEKVNLCIGTGMAGLETFAPVVGSTNAIVPGAAGTSFPVERLGIPAVVLADGPAGLRINPVRDFDSKTYYCTHFPIGTALAGTWNVELVEAVGRAIGNEVLEYGADVLLAPALNIHRHPLCGRNFEYYSEDPVVSGEIAKAYTLGIQRQGVGTSLKHFAANNQETNRNSNDARVSQRALREIYLKGFEIAVKGANPWTIMTSYNKINGVYSSESTELLIDILRNDWGYTGMVMTDWLGGSDAVAQMIAGNEMLQPGYPAQHEALIEGVKSGKLAESILDRNVKRILELVVKSPRFKGYAYSNAPNLKENATITRSSAAEAMVLLKNEEALPLAKTVKQIAVYGCTSYDIIPGGTGSGNVNRAYTVSLIEGLRNADYRVDMDILSRYKTYLDEDRKKNPKPTDLIEAALAVPQRPAEPTPTPGQLRNEAAANDMALITIGRISGESNDRNQNDFNLSREELALIESVAAAYHKQQKKVVVVLNIGGVMETASWKHLPDAILCAWQVGQEGGNSIADVLAGKQNPSGKLPMTFPIRIDDAASSANFPMDAPMINFFVRQENTNRKDIDYTLYEEDIYVGYRYFDTFGKEVSYPFGYGLSYTTFQYGEPQATLDDGRCTVSVTVTNTGKQPGKEVVQLYVQAPKGGLQKPEKELKAFAKTRLLKPGEQQTLTLTVATADLASFDEKASAWVVAPGTYHFLAGASSRDIKGTATLKVKGAKTAVSNALKPQMKLNLLRP